ncbi:hypothetical protein CDD81_6478 [Ophiocordyceps australis]|uniref:Uncharacterized protein n=1 Tax=Ophiocordyceps australis TaxID=1399860 RepID=A0A2C5YIA5_9HYPO|nr:hypothetical protein CDD81_6478 [Ophiocordyceps australis]
MNHLQVFAEVKSGNGAANSKTAEPRPVPAKKRTKAATTTGRASKKQRQSDDSGTEMNSELAALAASCQAPTNAWPGQSSPASDARAKNGTVEVAEVLQRIQERIKQERDEAIEQFEEAVAKSSRGSTLFTEPLTLDVQSLFSQRAASSSHDSGNETYTLAMESLTLADDVLDEYQLLSRGNLKVDKLNIEHWEQDIKDLGALNDAAKDVSLDILRDIVMPNKSTTAAAGKGRQGDDIRALAQEFLADSRPRRGEETWGSTAHALFKAFSSVVALLPDEKDG